MGDALGTTNAEVRVDAKDYWDHDGIHFQLVHVGFDENDIAAGAMSENGTSTFSIALSVDIDRNIDFTLSEGNNPFIRLISPYSGANGIELTLQSKDSAEGYAHSQYFYIESFGESNIDDETYPLDIKVDGKAFTAYTTVLDQTGGRADSIEYDPNILTEVHQGEANEEAELVVIQVSQEMIESNKTEHALTTAIENALQQYDTSQTPVLSTMNLKELLEFIGNALDGNQQPSPPYTIDADDALVILNDVLEDRPTFVNQLNTFGVIKLKEACTSLVNETIDINTELIRVTEKALLQLQGTPISQQFIDFYQNFKKEFDTFKTYASSSQSAESFFENLSPLEKMQTVLLGIWKTETLSPFMAPDEGTSSGIHESVEFQVANEEQTFASPLEGRLHLVTESSIWIQREDGSLHHFGQLRVSQDLLNRFRSFQPTQNQTHPEIMIGETLGNPISTNMSLSYEIHAFGEPSQKIETWPKFNPEGYWARGGLGLEVVTANGAEGVAIEEGSREQLTFRLNVAHTGEIRFKLRFNYEGTAEEDRVFAFYYETLGADGSRVQHYESELEVTFPATEADGSDQGASMEQRILVYVKSDEDRSFLSAFEKTNLQFALFQEGATTERFQDLKFELVSQETDVSMTGPEMMAEDQAKWGASSTDIQNLYRDASNAYYLSAYGQISNPLDLTSATNDRLKGFEKEQAAYRLQEKLAQNNYVVGNALDNIIFTGDGADILKGNAGDDRLFGEGGDDVLEGGEGNDTLLGGLGDDLQRGGQGDDQYIYGGGLDIIQELKGEGNDQVLIDNLEFAEVTLGVFEDQLLVKLNEQNQLLISCHVETVVFKDRTLQLGDVFKNPQKYNA
ncbi:calcium-binding protein, partial [Deltaproteobacteria bacterium TL4]